MKNFLLIILSLALLLSLCACSTSAFPAASPSASPAEQSAAPSAGASPAVSETPAPETETPAPTASASPASPSASDAQSAADKYVSVQYDMSGEYTDSVGNVYNYSYSVPRFDISDAADSVNQEIYDSLMPLIDEAQELMNGGFSLLVSGISYDAYLNGSIVSVVARANYDGTYMNYYVWSMDAESQSVADADALFAYTGMGADGTTLSDVAAACVGEYYAAQYKDLTNSFIREQYDKTLSAENLSEARYYLGEGGALFAVVKIYTVAGAEYYYEIIELHR